MKIESQKQQDHVFFLATENIFIHVNQPFKIQQEMIESRNFIPEAFMIHQIQESKRNGIDCNSFLKMATGERLMPVIGSEIWEKDEELLILDSPLSVEGNGDDKDEDEWDDDEEEWDEEDEDWDEEDEEWDEEDDEWDDDEDEVDDDEDEEEDWEEDGEAGE